MPWFRLDDKFHSHPKIIAAGNEATGLYVRCGTYAAEHLTDGFIPEHVVLLYGSPALAETLVRAKLWRRARSGWQMPDYLEYNPSREAVENGRKEARDRMRKKRKPRSDPELFAGTSGEHNANFTRSSEAPSRARPGINDTSVVNLTNPSSTARAGPEVIEAIIREVLDVTGRHITPDWAQRVAALLLDGRTPSSPAAYVRQAIRNEGNPRQRFLPLY